ncbi:MAG: sulfotransferase [Novosphingobium sp.]|uniref:sulfotransferase family protein n=1 Tax=Novosphingobium sp. TaxID=1874826 RepID=UPI0012BDCE21|nr:sulfotransferase [Novosphingobium sp.]MPS67280.1 sulfotransferase [Novosphingobium sp.]
MVESAQDGATHHNVIDITDLHHPVLDEIQRQVLAGAEAAGAHIVFKPQVILASAMAQTGLSDFGPQNFQERLAVWCQSIDEDANASAVTRANLFQMMIRYAATRLRIEDIVKRHPEILEIPIERPIIVAGLPRSGTTHLLGLLAADRRFRSLPWWEAIAPIAAPDEMPTPQDSNPRWTKAEQGWRTMEAILPHMAIMHEFSPDHISEDIELQAVDFSSYLIEWLALVPRWRDYYLSHDQSGTYAYLRKCLQVLTFLKGTNRWVIKCPQHMEQLPALYKTFPDATFVLTHRDPVGSIRSQLTMYTYAARMLRKTVDITEPLGYWPDRYERLLRACVRDRDVLPADQTIDVYFDEWTKAPDRILREIYRIADVELTDEALAELHRYLAEHGEQSRGKIVYDLERDFLVTAEELRRPFGFYFDRFDVAVEVA